MSTWTHAICTTCWNAKNPDRVPYHLTGWYPYRETCCYCGAATRSGIYVQDKPHQQYCDHKEEDE